MKLHDFAQHLVREVAAPVLSAGYRQLVHQLAANTQLAALVQEMGIDGALASDNPTIAALKKGNKELVTEAEKEAEMLMRMEVHQHYPGHAIVGEEHGYKSGSSLRWVFDPVDGTSAMIRKAMAEAFSLTLPAPLPAFGITLALVEGDTAMYSIVAQLRPQHGGLGIMQFWAGAKGHAPLYNGEELPPRHAPVSLAACQLASTVPEIMFATPHRWAGYAALAEACQGVLRDQNCVGFMQLLNPQNHTWLAYEADLAYHDVAALLPILEGAGMIVTDDAGMPLLFPESAIGHEFTILAGPPALHAQALAHLRRGQADPGRYPLPKTLQTAGYATKFPPAGGQ